MTHYGKLLHRSRFRNNPYFRPKNLLSVREPISDNTQSVFFGGPDFDTEAAIQRVRDEVEKVKKEWKK